MKGIFDDMPKSEFVGSRNMGNGITEETYTHSAYYWTKVKAVGKYRWEYASKKGDISLIELVEPYYASTPWEIGMYRKDKKSIKSFEQYATKKMAITRIMEMLA